MNRCVKFGGLGALVVVAGLSLMSPIPPGGRFRNDRLAVQSPAYFELKDGTITSVVLSNGDSRAPVAKRELIGSYQKEDGRWVFTTTRGEKIHFRTTLFSLQFVKPDGSLDKYPRLHGREH